MTGRIQTTEARAKEIKSRVEKLVTIAKKGDLGTLRLLNSRLSRQAAYKLYHDIGPRYKDRKGGYLRIRKGSVMRKRDGVKEVIIEFV